MLLTLIAGVALLEAIGPIALAGALVIVPARSRPVVIEHLASYATGTLLGAAFLGLLPEAMGDLGQSSVLSAALSGIMLFFVLEKLLRWRHCHGRICEVHECSGPLVLFGDALHNFTDGVIMAAAFLESVPLGIATSVAVISHEIPQEVGDFAILLDAGYRPRQAFAFNIISGSTALAGALLTYVFLCGMAEFVPYAAALAAGSFVYVAVADLFPALHRHTQLVRSLLQLTLILGGIGTIALLRP